ncbi:hypothetical protein [Actibacterium pelagium]|uniref:Seryl-tRNA synthetase n=1 Tax=Actibacterium pelagium TaxID=2029103 RepID=A0A917AC00_9RHOB|nr:hypothetical protein [Actibacterium pelagium]GGE40152.1 seryl-tRNA synthetase [Actibacterium pelagium]
MIDPIKAVLTFCAALFFVLSPALTGGFSGYDPALFPVPFEKHPAQPAGYAFAIWGLIYAWLTVMVAVGLFTGRATDPVWEGPRLPLILSLAPGAAWIGVANQFPVLATLLIFWMLGTALWALHRCPDTDRWLLRVPVALYAGWLTAASFVSLALVGTGFGVGDSPLVWAVIALAGATATGTLSFKYLTKEPAYAVALCWGFIGIVVANSTDNFPVALLAAAATAVVGKVGLKFI